MMHAWLKAGLPGCFALKLNKPLGSCLLEYLASLYRWRGFLPWGLSLIGNSPHSCSSPHISITALASPVPPRNKGKGMCLMSSHYRIEKGLPNLPTGVRGPELSPSPTPSMPAFPGRYPEATGVVHSLSKSWGMGTGPQSGL